MQLSIIIPVFKVKDYIRQCLESVLAIERISMEVILVQDTQVDDSLDSVEDLLSDKRIYVLDQRNAGLSAARNAGFPIAKGEYVYFLDSDDFIDAKAFEEFFCQYESQRPDILTLGFNYIEEQGELLREENAKLSFPKSGVHEGKAYLIGYYSFPMVWMNIFRCEFLRSNNLTFLEGIYFEDVEFTPRALYLAQKICVTDRTIYFYRIRPDSLQQQEFNQKKLTDALRVANSLLDFSDRQVPSVEKECKCYFERRSLSVFFGVIGFYLQQHAVERVQEQAITKLMRRIIHPMALPLHFVLMYLLYRLSPQGMYKVVRKRYKLKYFKQ